MDEFECKKQQCIDIVNQRTGAVAQKKRKYLMSNQRRVS